MSMFGVDLDSYIPEFLQDVVDPWNIENTCSDISSSVPGSAGLCDISTLTLGMASTINCSMAFICKQNTISVEHYGHISLITDQIWIDLGTTVTTAKLSPGANGADGSTESLNGSNGETGKNAPNLSITVNKLMETSDKNLQFISNGGDGGNGGSGHEGRNNMDQAPTIPSPNDVVNQGALYDQVTTSNGNQCHGHCETHDTKYYYQLPKVTDATCGGTGGNGGNGGDGGAPGTLLISGESGLSPINTRNGGRGGHGGNQGNGGYGSHYNMMFRAYKLAHQCHNCHSIHSCDQWFEYSNHEYGNSDYSTPCPGAEGTPGIDGRAWTESGLDC